MVVIPVNTKAKQRTWTRKNGIEWAQLTRSSAPRRKLLMEVDMGVQPTD